MNNFSVVIPTLNEKENILPLLKRIETGTGNSNLNFEVIFIDDGSTDGTRAEIEKYQGPLKIRLIQRETERGLSTAVLAGASVADSDIIVVMDADLSHPPENIIDIVTPVIEGRYDFVLGSRYLKNSRISNWPKIRRIGSLLASIPARLLTEINDPLSGFFAVKRDDLQQVKNARGYKIALEILCSRELKVLEVPIHFNDRSNGTSKMSRRVVLDYLRQLISLSGLEAMFSNKLWLLPLALLAGILDFCIFSRALGSGFNDVSAHILSYLATMLCFLSSLVYSSSNLKKFSDHVWKMLFQPIITAGLGLFLHGGMLSLSSGIWGINSPQTAISLSITTLLVALTCGAQFLRVSHQKRTKAIPFVGSFIILLIAYSLVLRFVFLGSSSLLMEEAYYWNYAQHMSSGYLDHPPGVALLIHMGTSLFGTNEFGVRIGAFFCWFITAGFIFSMTRSIFSTKVAIRSILLVAILPIFFGTGLVITPDAPLIMFWSGALYFLHEAVINHKNRSWVGVGICIGAGMASKYTIVLMAPALLVFMLIDSKSRKLFFKPYPYLAAVIALAIFSPVIWWNYNNEWASFLFQTQGRIMKAARFSTPELIASILLLLSPTGFLAVIALFKKRKRTDGSRSLHFTQEHRSRLYCITMCVVPLLVFVFISFTKEIKLNWTGPLWISILPYLAYGMVWPEGKLDRFVARSWKPTIVAVSFVYGFVLHYFSLGFPGLPLPKNPAMTGWDNLASQVEDVARNITAQSGHRPVVVGMDKYKIASGMAFYRYKNLLKTPQNGTVEKVVDETTGRHLFGYNDLMYKYWHNPVQLPDNNMIILAKDKQGLSTDLFKNLLTDLGPIKELHYSKDGREVGTYYYRIGEGYLNNSNEVAEN